MEHRYTAKTHQAPLQEAEDKESPTEVADSENPTPEDKSATQEVISLTSASAAAAESPPSQVGGVTFEEDKGPGFDYTGGTPDDDILNLI